MQFCNDPKGGQQAWADCVYIRGYEYYSVFAVYLGKIYGNCGLATVSAFDVGGHYQTKGIGTWFMNWTIRMLTEMGFTIAIGTTNPTQAKMEPILRKTGWEEIESCNFKNRRTQNAIKFWRIVLPENKV
jgi:GNAT superfamily N-acetyltransferase